MNNLCTVNFSKKRQVLAGQNLIRSVTRAYNELKNLSGFTNHTPSPFFIFCPGIVKNLDRKNRNILGCPIKQRLRLSNDWRKWA